MGVVAPEDETLLRCLQFLLEFGSTCIKPGPLCRRWTAGSGSRSIPAIEVRLERGLDGGILFSL